MIDSVRLGCDASRNADALPPTLESVAFQWDDLHFFFLSERYFRLRRLSSFPFRRDTPPPALVSHSCPAGGELVVNAARNND